jgi:hypothetical protein
MDKKTKSILQYVFWIAVAVVLVYFCLRSIDWEQFSLALKQCRWGYVLLSMLLGTLVFLIRGNRWRMLLLPFDPSTSRVTTFNSYNICMAVNLALPRAGEVVKLGYVVKHSALDKDGKRMNNALGVGEILYSYDSKGAIEKVTYQDTEGKPCVCADGYAGYRDTRDADGATVKRTFLGTDGNPAETHDGYSEIRYEYDETKQLSSTRYYDLNGTEVPGK